MLGCGKEDMNKDLTTLRVAFKYDKPAAHYDPANIMFAPEYDFLENIYSTLVQYSPQGELIGSIAERFEWIGSEARFTIRSDLRTIDGRIIDANDVEISLKRLFILAGNTHGNLKDIVCPAITLKTLSDNCPGMEVADGGRVLVLKLKEKKPFLFPMLASMDFAVIPKDSIDKKTLKIKDYRNTSGPYFVLKDSPHGEIELAPNPNHFHYSKKIPQKVLFVPSGKTDKIEALKFFEKGKVDFITTTDSVPPDIMIDYANKNRKLAELHLTYPLDTFLLIFTEKGRKRFSRCERHAIGEKFKKIFLSTYLKKSGYEVAKQIFPAFGGGGLSERELSKITFDKCPNNLPPVKIKVWNINFTGDFESLESEYIKIFPKIEFINVRKIPGRTNYADEGLDEPDFYLMRTDMGFQEDINLLSYYLGIDFFYLKKSETKKWLLKYVSTQDKKIRLSMVRDLHFKTLDAAVVIPLVKTPYTALVRKPWRFKMSKFHANDPIWQIYLD